jgi:hypothetical protein
MMNALWDLTACGSHGSGPFRLVIHYERGSIAEYFQDVDQALQAIEAAETQPDGRSEIIAADKLMIRIPRAADLTKQFFSEEAWANGARH